MPPKGEIKRIITINTLSQNSISDIPPNLSLKNGISFLLILLKDNLKRHQVSLGIAAVILFTAISPHFLRDLAIPLVKLQGEEFLTESTQDDLGVSSEVQTSLFSLALASPIYFSQAIGGPPNGQNGVESVYLGQGGEIFEFAQIENNSFLSTTSPFGALEEPSRYEIIVYEVEEGDTLSEIASVFGVSTVTLVWANNLRNADYIKPGTKLKIPPTSGVLHKVRDGETLAVLVQKYKGDLQKTLEINSLPADGAIISGEIIVIADGRMPQPTPSPSIYTRSSLPKYTSSAVSLGYFIYPTSGRNWGRRHANNGVDISNSCGTPIFAAQEGKVISSDGVGWNGGFGKFIEIQHPNGVVTLYSHNSRNLVSVGEYVKQGQLIAYMGSTGRSTGCHLHFEVHGARNPLLRY